MRKLADKYLIEQAMKVLKGRARIKRTMWSRRAQEYEAKINSGDLIAVAEVVRDLFRSERQPEQPIPSASFMNRRWSGWPAKCRGQQTIDEEAVEGNRADPRRRRGRTTRPKTKLPPKRQPERTISTILNSVSRDFI